MGVDTACVALGHEVARVGNGGEVLLLVVLDSNNVPGISGLAARLVLGGVPTKHPGHPPAPHMEQMRTSRDHL